MRVVLFMIALLCAGGCSAQPPPDAPMPPFTLTVPPRPSILSPPVVPRPLDASTYRTRICEIFTNEQAVALGFPGPPDQSEAPQFLSCIRESKDPPIDLALLYSSSELFGKVYRGNAAPLDYAKLVTISGQPALEKGSRDPLNVVRWCTIVLGLTNDQAIQIDVRDPKGSGACDRATKVAEAIVHNLGG